MMSAHADVVDDESLLQDRDNGSCRDMALTSAIPTCQGPNAIASPDHKISAQQISTTVVSKVLAV